MSKTDVVFQRGTLDEINSTDKVDGQILLTTDLGLNNKMFTDVKKYDGTIERIRIAGTNDVDTSLSDTSTNPVMNKTITTNINTINSNIETAKGQNDYNKEALNEIVEAYGSYTVLWERDAEADSKGYTVYPLASDLNDRTKGLPQEYNLSSPISDMAHGIIIIFSAVNLKCTVLEGATSGGTGAIGDTSSLPGAIAGAFGKVGNVTYAPQDYHFVSRFVHKKEVELFPGAGHSFLLIGSNDFSWSSTALHYLYINDDVIKDNVRNLFDCANYTSYTGYDTNTPITGANGIRYSNSRFCIRAILGV